MIDYKIVEIDRASKEGPIKEFLDSSYEGVRILLVLDNDNTACDDQVPTGSFKKYFLPRVKIENYNIEIDGRSFHDQPINDSIK